MFFEVVHQEPTSELPDEGWMKIHERDGVTHLWCDTGVKSPIKTLRECIGTHSTIQKRLFKTFTPPQQKRRRNGTRTQQNQSFLTRRGSAVRCQNTLFSRGCVLDPLQLNLTVHCQMMTHGWLAMNWMKSKPQWLQAPRKTTPIGSDTEMRLN